MDNSRQTAFKRTLCRACFISSVVIYFWQVFFCQDWRYYEDDMNGMCSLLSTISPGTGWMARVLFRKRNVLFPFELCVDTARKLLVWCRSSFGREWIWALPGLFLALSLITCLIASCSYAAKYVGDILDENMYRIAADPRIPDFQQNRTVDKSDLYYAHSWPFGSIALKQFDLPRYEGEDVEMECTSDIVWLRQHPPHEDILNVSWSHNDKGLVWSNRHHYDVTYKELSQSETDQTQDPGLARLVRTHGLSMHRVTVKLQIRRLTVSDFGTYMCFVICRGAYSELTWMDMIQRARARVLKQKKSAMEKLTTLYINNTCNSSDRTPTGIINYLRCHLTHFSLENLWRQTLYWEQVLSSQIFTGYEPGEPLEYSVRMCLGGKYQVQLMPPETYRVWVPPGAIVSIYSSYWQLEHHKDDIIIEYFVNGQSIHRLPSVGRCSALALLYWKITYRWSKGVKYIKLPSVVS